MKKNDSKEKNPPVRSKDLLVLNKETILILRTRTGLRTGTGDETASCKCGGGPTKTK
jgi:hypothetical protein